MVSDYLQRGKQNAIPADRLQRMTGYKNKRKLTKQIERERIEGALILSNGNGYYLPENADEIDRYIKSMSRRAKSIFRVLKAARMAAGQNGDQITLWEILNEGADNEQKEKI